MKKTPSCVLTTALAVFTSSLLAAQTAAPTAPAVPDIARAKDESALELSPFVTTAERDRGYAATSSLAGTRIRTDLRDIANSISVVTSDFMKDVNATSATSLLSYTGNTETAGPAGNYAASALNGVAIDQVSSIRSPNTNSRVRGLASADLTRDYFPTTTVFDSYNTERVEISRGPNAALFGLGSPGGIINSQLIRPTLMNKNTVEFAAGTFGTYRSSADFDRVLIPGVFGLRIALLEENQKFQQTYTYL